MSHTDETSTDGGAQLSDDQLFGQLAEADSVHLSKWERFDRTLDAYVLAPGRVAWNDWRTRFGIVVIALFAFAGTVAPWLVESPATNQAPVNHPPFSGGLSAITEQGGWIDVTQASFGSISIPWLSFQYPLGADNYGSPIGRQLIHATPDMLELVIAGAIVSVGFAVLIGVTAGYKGGKVDSVLMSVTDIVMTMPGLPLVIVIAAIYPPRQAWLVGVILAIDAWPGLARALRSQVLTLREESYVEASRTMGLPSRTILSRDITPQLMPYILINAAQAGRKVIFESVALYFLGVLPFTTANWGIMMDTAYTEGYALVNLSNFYQLLWPMTAIIVISFGFILFSQGMDRVFNPRIRARHAKKAGADEEEIPN
ncbi:ABC transporter permease (plasmid) [Natrinema zhouii]|uniref:ABC transporter permease n=1 Tax=Natrinema zhouii TaxID=1710539 RepID=UPI001D000002|nr:ABC transporter permease [Natrinema zhouii]UHQ98539.1 ABC transporter permease [Natrinema zhouii]